MQVFLDTALQMAILFLIIVAGALARRARIMGDEFDALLSRLVMNFSMPALILSSVLNSENLPSAPTIASILLFSALAYALTTLIAYFVPMIYRKATRRERGAHSFVILFGNVGFIGFPVISTVLGSTAVIYAAIFNILYNLVVFTVGIAMLRQGGDEGASGAGESGTSESGDGFRGRAGLAIQLKRLWRHLANPCMAACVVAPVLALLGITDEGGFFGRSCELLGQLTIPASMMVIGSTLAKMSVKDMLGQVSPYVTSALRLLVVPIVMLLVFRFFVDDPMVLGVLVLEMGMPAASLGTMLSLLYGGDIDTIMRCTFLSTILSIATIPFIAMLLG